MIRTAHLTHQCACCKGVIEVGDKYVRRRIYQGSRRRIKRFHMECADETRVIYRSKGVDRDALVALYKQHKNIRQVSEILGVSCSTTTHHLKRAGVEIVQPVPRIKPKPQIEATPWTGLAKKACYRPTISGRVFQSEQL